MDAILYVADSIQPLASGKPLVSGLYPDRVVLFNLDQDMPQEPTPERPFALQDLSFLITLTGLPTGDYKGSVRFFDPRGNEMPYTQSDLPITAMTGSSVNVNVSMRPFVAPHFGEYKVRIEVDQWAAECNFEMRAARTERQVL